MGIFRNIKRSLTACDDIDEKIEYLNKELEKTGLHEMMTTPNMYQQGTKVPNQNFIDFQSLSLNGFSLGLSAPDGNNVGGAVLGIDPTTGVSGAALSPPDPTTGLRRTATTVINGLGDTITLRPGQKFQRGSGNNAKIYTMGSAVWFYNSGSGTWNNVEFFTEPGQDGVFGYWDTIKQGQLTGLWILNTTGIHPAGDILSLLSGINFGENGVIGPPQTIVLQKNDLGDVDFLPINIPELSKQAFDYLTDKAKDLLDKAARKLYLRSRGQMPWSYLDGWAKDYWRNKAKESVDFMKGNFESNMEGIVKDLKDHWAQSWEDVKNIPKDLQKFGNDALNILNQIADKVPVMDYAIDIAQSILDNEPKTKTDVPQEDIDRYIKNTNIGDNNLPINSKPVGYADENIYVDENGNVKSNIGPNGEKGYYRKNNTDNWSEVPGGKLSFGATNPIAARGKNQTQIIWDGNGDPVLRVTDHAYFNSQSTDKGEVPGLGFLNPKLVIANLFTKISDRTQGRTGGKISRVDRRTGRVDRRPDITTPNTGAMEGYPSNIRGDSKLQVDITFDQWPDKQKEQWEKRKNNLTVSTTKAGNPIRGYNSERRKRDFNMSGTYVPESKGIKKISLSEAAKLGHFDPEVLTVDINDIRKGIMPEFPKDPPPEMVGGYAANSRLAPKTVERDPFIKITKKDLAKNHKLKDSEIKEFMDQINAINEFIKKHPEELIYAQTRYPKSDPRLAQLNWEMDQRLNASKEYMDKHYPENQKLFTKIQKTIKKNIELTDPKSFKGVKIPKFEGVDLTDHERRKEVVTRHYKKAIKIKKLFSKKKT